MALFLLIPALIIFFLVLRKEYLRLDQVRITISGLCLFFSLCVEVVCRGLEGWGAKLRLRYIWLGAQAYIFSLVLATDLLSIVFSSFRSSGLLVLDIKKVPNFGSYTNWLMSRHAGVVYLFGCLSASQMHLFRIFTVVFSYFFCIPASPPPSPPLLYDNNTSRLGSATENFEDGKKDINFILLALAF